MSAYDDLYSPIFDWRAKCMRIVQYVESHRAVDRYIYRLDRPRPHGALFLREMLEAFWEHGQRCFVRLQYPDVNEFTFTGDLIEVDDDHPFPGYAVNGEDNPRSIEDVNLVPNTYTSFYIFLNEADARLGMKFVCTHYYSC